MVAHLDQNAGNNDPDNLAFMCQTHHWMFDAGLYPIEAIKLLRSHWQSTGGVPSHKARMKDAGAKAASKVGELVASHVIARPHEDLVKGFLGEANAVKK